MSRCVKVATSSPSEELNRAYALYISYTHWRSDKTLDTRDYIFVADSTGIDPTELDECWDDGCYPDGSEIHDPEDDNHPDTREEI